VRIATGKSHVLALTHKDALFGWGSNKYAQLGIDPAIQTEAKLPQLIAPDKKIKMQKIFASKYHSMAIGRNDVLYFWGSVICVGV
jgi:alpha-tubulin suppressor-like RCC1 family protein